MSTRVSLIGAPSDVGAGTRGTSMGPEALRVAGLAEALMAQGVEVRDCGNLSGPQNPWQPALDGYRHLQEVIEWNQRIHDACEAAFAESRMPVLLGGDHSLVIGSISAAARQCRRTGQRLAVLWLDAHADFNTSSVTPSGNLHGMPLACLCGAGPDALIGMSGVVPAMSATAIRQIGVRSVDPGERHLVQEAQLEVFDMRTIDEYGMRAVMQRALYDIDEDTHLHVSFDVDFLDPDIAPGGGTVVPGGPTYREAQLCMEMIADTGRLCSLDVMELNPALDDRNRTGRLAVDLIESLFGKSTLLRRAI
jgi:arginase